MNRIRNKIMTRCLGLVVLCLAGLWLVAGCGSDPVAPQEEGIPALDKEDVAWQASVLALAVAQVAPQAIQFTDKSDPLYSYSLDDPVLGLYGEVYLDYRMGDEDGAHATSDDGTWVNIFTESGKKAVIETPVGGAVAMTFNLKADIDRGAETAVFLEGSTGTYQTGDYEDGVFTVGLYSATFQLNGLTVDANQDFPVAGYLIFTSGGKTITVEFGGNILTVHLEDVDLVINLETGDITKS